MPVILPPRITLALDDTPNQRYGPYVEGAGIHYNPTPGPAGSPYVYGHIWVVLFAEPTGWLAFFCTDVEASVEEILAMLQSDSSHLMRS